MRATWLPRTYRICTASPTVFRVARGIPPRGDRSGQGNAAGGPARPWQVTYFYITDDTQGRFFPGLVLKVLWDDEAEPSIDAPLSDSFGAIGGKTIDYQSVPMQINHACFMCYLPMPFSQRARFVLANDGNKPYSQSMAYGIDYEQGDQFAQEKSRLHGVLRCSNPTQNGMHTLLEVQGRGHYVGNFLQVHSRFAGWWGEGDTLFHVDAKAMTHTPGTEDEYGSCWGFETQVLVPVQWLLTDGEAGPSDVSLEPGQSRAFPEIPQGRDPEPAPGKWADP